MSRSSFPFLLAGVLVTLLWAGFSGSAFARTRLENICVIQGQEEVRLNGLGLVVGLNGTGDGAKNLPTMRALRSALLKMNHPVAELDLRNGENIAVVMIDATIPRTGLRRGQKIDGYISAIMGCKSLRGGRLLSTPLTPANLRQDLVVALAGGAVSLEEKEVKTSGKISLGVDLLEDVNALFVDHKRGHLVTLMIDPNHASFWTSSEVARVVNGEFSFEAGGRPIARSASPSVVEVVIPPQYQETPVEFIAQMMEVGIEIPHTQARVVLNAKTGVVIVTGEVEISPVVVTHKNFTLEVGGPETTNGPFVPLSDGYSRQSPQQLKELVTAMNQLKVPAADIIAIIRELHVTGKLHAELIDR